MHALQSRVRELERERGDAVRQTHVLLAVQRAIVKIGTANGADDIIANLLHGIRTALGYSRVIYFPVDPGGGITEHVRLDGDDRIEPTQKLANVENERSLALALNRGSMFARRGTSVLLPLVNATRTLGLLYADDRRGAAAKGGDEALIAVAAAALGNDTKLARAMELATIDPLTGLLNRRAVAERLSSELESCRTGPRALTYVMVDVDDLKAINDTRGHAEGDATLKKVAAVLRRSSREQDIVGRVGGDEFVIMLSGVDPDLSRALVTRLSQNLRAHDLSCSIGAALLGADAVDEPSLARSADRALYATKAAGKNGFSFA